MTVAQFKRLKPKYKVSWVVAWIILIAICIGILLGISALFSLARTHLSTKTLEDVSPRNALLQSSFAKIVEALGQEDPENIYVMNSKITCNNLGAVQEFDMEFVDVKSSKEAQTWVVHIDEKKSFMRRTAIENQNRSSLSYTKISFAQYFPSLSRISAPHFLERIQKELPVGEGGLYIFQDSFDDSKNPQFTSYLHDGHLGFIVSSSGGVSNLTETYQPTPGTQVPLLLSTQAVNEKKSNEKRTVLLDPEERAVVLFGTGPWTNL